MMETRKQLDYPAGSIIRVKPIALKVAVEYLRRLMETAGQGRGWQ